MTKPKPEPVACPCGQVIPRPKPKGRIAKACSQQCYREYFFYPTRRTGNPTGRPKKGRTRLNATGDAQVVALLRQYSQDKGESFSDILDDALRVKCVSLGLMKSLEKVIID